MAWERELDHQMQLRQRISQEGNVLSLRGSEAREESRVSPRQMLMRMSWSGGSVAISEGFIFVHLGGVGYLYSATQLR